MIRPGCGGTFLWCASYAPLRGCASIALMLGKLDLHNIESELARSHARALRWPLSWASQLDLGSPTASWSFNGSPASIRFWLPQRTTGRVCGTAMCISSLMLCPSFRFPPWPKNSASCSAGTWSITRTWRRCAGSIVEIWPLVREKSPEIQWRVIGRNPHAVDKVLAGDSRILLVGPVEDAVAEIARARVCVVPLLSGSGTRFKILEAWAAERAVVSTRVGAEGLGARNGEHLLVTEAPGSFADAIVRAVQDQELRRKLGTAGRALYLDKFTWPTAWKSLPF